MTAGRADAGLVLRLRREARGLSVDDAAKATKIPVAHVEAIEAARFDDLPEGPYRAGLLRAYCAWLGVEPDPALLRSLVPAAPARRLEIPLWAVRGLAAVVCVVLAVASGWMLFSDWGDGTETTEAAPPAPAPDQRVSVTARRTTHITLLVDGEVVLDRQVPGGETVDVAGHREVEVRLEGADAARVEYNGELVVPQGRQDVPRRLVFVDDLDQGAP